MPEYACVYILSSEGKRLYIGVTTKLEQRIWQHKSKITKTHSRRSTTSTNTLQLTAKFRPLAALYIA